MCENPVYSIVGNIGVCSLNPYTNYSAILTVLNDTTVNDEYYLNPDCSRHPEGELPITTNVCLGFGDGMNPEVQSSMIYYSGSSGTASSTTTAPTTYTVTFYYDAKCSRSAYTLEATEGLCGNNPHTNYSAILTSDGSTNIYDMYYLEPDCEGDPSIIMLALDTCIESSDGKNKDIHGLYITASSATTPSVSKLGGGEMKIVN